MKCRLYHLIPYTTQTQSWSRELADLAIPRMRVHGFSESRPEINQAVVSHTTSDAVHHGEILQMVEAPPTELKRVDQYVRRRHPAARYRRGRLGLLRLLAEPGSQAVPCHQRTSAIVMHISH